MGKIILNLAISLDGFIADIDGGFDWIVGDGDHSHDTEKVFDFNDFIESIGVIVMGSKAYEDSPEGSLETYKDKKILVATTRDMSGSENTEFIKGDICSRILEEKNCCDKDIWLYGGGGLVEPFIEANIIDEYIIGVIPTILGKGRPLFTSEFPTIKLHLQEMTINEGVAIIRYTKR